MERNECRRCFRPGSGICPECAADEAEDARRHPSQAATAALREALTTGGHEHAPGCCCDACNPDWHPESCPGGCGGYGRTDPESYPPGQRPRNPCDGKA